MAEKLGEMLVRNGLITREQLDSALEAQLMFGGRLGTNLVELGHIGASTLAEFLSRKLELPALDPRALDSIPPAALACLSAEVAEKLSAIPLRLEHRVLHVAMADPTDLHVIDELSFITGCEVQPVVAPELLLTYGLETLYDVHRKTRFLRIATDESRPGRIPGPAAAAPFAEDAPDSPDPVRAGAGSYELVDAMKELADARKPRSILRVLLQFLTHRFERVAILAIEGDRARGWSQVGCMAPPTEGQSDPFHALHYSESESPLLAKAAASEALFLESNSDEQSDEGDALAWLMWKPGATDPTLVIPIRYGDRMVAVALARSELQPGALTASESFGLLASRAVLALDLVRLRERILRF